MAKPDTVYSLFGIKSPQQVAREQMEASQALLAVQQDPYARLGTALGMGFGRLFGGPNTELEQARQLDEIRRGYQPGNLQSMAQTYTRLQEAGAPAETLERLSADITARSQEVNEQAQARRAQNAAVEFVSKANPELGQLVASGAMEPGEAIKAVRDAQKPTVVGDVLVNPANIDPETRQAAIVFDARKREPNTQYSILTAQEKTALGLPVGVNYQRSPNGQITRIAGADIPAVGSIPVGYQMTVTTGTNPGQTMMRMDPIPGSPAAREQQQQLEATQNKLRNTGKKVNSVTAIIDEARTLINDPDAWTTGLAGKGVDVAGQLTGGLALAGTPRLALRETLGTIRANIGFDRLQQMRDESPTGGALGQVAIQELNDLQRTLGSLNPDLDADTLSRNLDKVETQYSRTAEALANAYTDQQLINAGIPELIPYRTGEFNPETGNFERFPTASEFDISVLPEDIRAGWNDLDEETKKMLMEAYK